MTKRFIDAASALSFEEDGAAMAEYALLLVGIAIVVGAAAAAFGLRVGGLYGLFTTLFP